MEYSKTDSKELKPFPSDKITETNYKEEYEKLKATLGSVLEKYDIVQCNGCKEYSRDCDRCDLCDIWSCGCIKIKHIKTWYLSGTCMCEKCILTHCHFCSVSKGLSENDKNLCSKCEIRFKIDNSLIFKKK